MTYPTEPVLAVPAPTATLWRPAGALVFAILGLVGAIPLAGAGLITAAAGLAYPASNANTAGGGLMLLAVGLAVGIPMTIYLFRSRKPAFFTGIGFMVAVPILFVTMMIVVTLSTRAMFDAVVVP